MKSSEEERIFEALKSHLSVVPFLRFSIEQEVRSQTSQGGTPKVWDAVVHLRLPVGDVIAALVFKTSGEIGNVKLALQELREWRNFFFHGLADIPEAPGFSLPYGIFTAPYISPRGAQFCREAGMGYCDLAGNCFLSFGQVYVLRENWPNPAKRTATVSLWAAKSERVLRALLENPERVWKTQDLAEEAKVSTGLVSNVRSQLADREWIERGESGFCLREPLTLLQEWAAHRKLKRAPARVFYSLDKTGEIENQLARWGKEHDQNVALTEFSGAARLAPYARYSQASAYVDGDLEVLRRDLDLRTTNTGSNVRLLLPRDEGVFYGARTLDNVMVVSPIQVYLDLKALEGRGDEAAQYLLERTLQPRWAGESR